MRISLFKVLTHGLAGMLLLAVSLFSFNALALPTIADYGARASTSHVAISPSGHLIAYRKEANNKVMLVIYSREHKKILSAVDVSNVNLKSVYFASDDFLIFTASEYQRVRGFLSKFDLSSAFVVNTENGKARQLLVPGDGMIYKGQTGLGRIVGLSPDGKYAFMPTFIQSSAPSAAPDYALVKVRLDRKLKPRGASDGSTISDDFFVDAEGHPIVEEQYSDKTNLHTVLVKQDNHWIKIYEEEAAIRNISLVGLTQDGQSLVVLASDEKAGRTGYFTMSLKDGSFSQSLFSRDDADIESVITDINRVVYGVRYAGFKPSYQFFDKSIQAKMDALMAKFPNQSVWLKDWTLHWNELLVYVEGDQYSGDYFVGNVKKVDFLTRARTTILTKDIQRVVATKYPAADGLIIPALITIPNQHAQKMQQLPLIVLPHGGPESYDTQGFDWLSQAFSSRGYLVLQPQFRGSSGFGLKHTRAGYGEWGKKMQSDITDGVNMLIKEGLADPKRVCIVGWSYGGYAALAGGAFTPELYQCVVSINGVSDLQRMLTRESRRRGSDNWVVSYWEKNIANNQADEKFLDSISPVNFAPEFKAPVLLIHAKDDTVVNIEQSEKMHSKLKSAKKVVEFKKIKGDNHNLESSENRIEALTAVLEFVDKKIGVKASTK